MFNTALNCINKFNETPFPQSPNHDPVFFWLRRCTRAALRPVVIGKLVWVCDILEGWGLVSAHAHCVRFARKCTSSCGIVFAGFFFLVQPPGHRCAHAPLHDVPTCFRNVRYCRPLPVMKMISDRGWFPAVYRPCSLESDVSLLWRWHVIGSSSEPWTLFWGYDPTVAELSVSFYSHFHRASFKWPRALRHAYTHAKRHI